MNEQVPLLQKSKLGSMDGCYMEVDFPLSKTRFLKTRASGEYAPLCGREFPDTGGIQVEPE